MMNMKISKIKKLSNSKYDIVIDNHTKITTYDEVILNNNLLFDKNIDEKMLNKIKLDNEYYNIYNKVVKFINIKIRSEKEIIDYLKNNKVEEKNINSIIETLRTKGLINDEYYAKAFISDRLNLSNDGPIKIKKSLIEHNISDDIIDSELFKIDNNFYKEKINKIIEKKIILNKKYSEFLLKQKITNELKLLGFYSDDINECLEKIKVDNDLLIEEYYDKIFNKLSAKYEGSVLYTKLKEKLYQKGFSLNEINDLLSKKKSV